MPATDGGRSGWFGGLADEAERFVQVRIERLAAAARQQTDQLAEHAGERFARHLVEQVAQRLAARLAWAAVAVGAVVIAVWLLAVGLAGALGEVLGRAWLGQLATGAFTLLAALVAGGIARARTRRRRKAEATTAPLAAARTATPEAARERDAPDAAAGVTDALSREAVQAGTDMLRRHPLASMAAISAAGLLAGSLLARSNGRSRQDD